VHAEHVNKGDSGYDANERTGNSERPASNVVGKIWAIWQTIASDKGNDYGM
jgi:hypothetical protein